MFVAIADIGGRITACLQLTAAQPQKLAQPSVSDRAMSGTGPDRFVPHKTRHLPMDTGGFQINERSVNQFILRVSTVVLSKVINSEKFGLLLNHHFFGL